LVLTPHRDKFHNSFLKWLVTAYGLALLPFLAKLIVAQGPYQAEFCLFILVLAASGILEAAFHPSSSASRTLLIAAGIFCICYGALGYGKLSTSQDFQAVSLLWWVVGVLSAAYLLYKIPLLWKERG
jgi:hypothetical protein